MPRKSTPSQGARVLDKPTVYLSNRGTFYIKPEELLRSEAARELMRAASALVQSDKASEKGAEDSD